MNSHSQNRRNNQNTLAENFCRLAALLLISIATASSQTYISSDYIAIIGSTGGTSVNLGGLLGTTPIHGKAAFPILMDANFVPTVAASRYGNGVSSTAARAVVAAHTSFLYHPENTSQLLENSVLWASRKSTPSSITVGSADSATRTFFSTRGYQTKAVSASMSGSSDDLSGVDVFIGDFHSGFPADAITKINTHTANGGGIVAISTPWALSAQAYNDLQGVLLPFGLSVTGAYAYNYTNTFTVAPSAYPIYHSALNALEMLKEGTTLSFEEKRQASGAVDMALAVRPNSPEILTGLQALEDSGYGLISPTLTAPLDRLTQPVEAMLTRFQSGKFDKMTADQLIAHPGAVNWPGAPQTGTTVSRTYAVDGNVPNDYFMNQGFVGRRIETCLYAAPGATITVTIPSDKAAAGLQLQIGCHLDQNFNLAQWRRFPKITRAVTLTQTTTQTGNVFGGLIWIMVPAGSNLGTFDITVSGALEAPSFQLGVNTDADWNNTLKTKPGAWGVIMTDNVPAYGNTPGFTLYVSRNQLQKVTSAETVARHWKSVLQTADDTMGYAAYRKRGESLLSDVDIFAGSGHAGWPAMMRFGDDSTTLDLKFTDGLWGYYHEIGHGFQDDFDNGYDIGTHVEIEVNLVPGLLATLLHDRTCWDGHIHGVFDGASRLANRNSFLASPSADQTWANACGIYPIAYDFHYNLAEAFGWKVYKTALGRLMAWLQGGTDSTLSAHGGAGTQARRDRFYIIMCDAAGRNLNTYFQRYGLGVTGKGYEISESAKSLIQAKGYPAWTDNTPIDSVSNPGPLNVSETLTPGTVIADLDAIDVEEPGTIWTWSIASGNTANTFTIDKRTGELKVGSSGLDGKGNPSFTLEILVQDNGVPRQSATQSVTVNVTALQPPATTGYAVLNANSTMSGGTNLGRVIAADTTRTLSSATILSGNDSGAFAVNTAGEIILQNPGSLPAASLRTLVVFATDNTGASGSVAVRVLVNSMPGLKEERWNGITNFSSNSWEGTPAYTGNLTSATSGEFAGDSYSRRLTGWLIAPSTGQYQFWISSDDGGGRLYLGTSSLETSKSQIAYVGGSTLFQDFEKEPSQASASVTLRAGQAYWFEAQQADSVGSDHISVAWQGGPLNSRAIIGGAYLVPNQTGAVSPGPLPQAPVFTSDLLSGPDATQAIAYSRSLPGAATDPDTGDALSYSKIKGPSWLTVSSGGALSGTPAAGDVGPNTFTIRVTDSVGLIDEAELRITVLPPFGTAPYAAQDIFYDAGQMGGPGAYSCDAAKGTHTLRSSGIDVWDTQDAFRFVSREITGDCDIRARVVSQTWTSQYAKAGVMIRETTAAGSKNVAAEVMTGHGFALQYRSTLDAGSAGVQGPSLNTYPNNWVRLVRAGDLLTGYGSADGQTWTVISSVTLPMNSTLQAGLFASSNNISMDEIAVFDKFSINSVPSPWNSADIGGVTISGGVIHKDGIFYQEASGWDIWGTEDQFHYTWQAASGDCSITAKVEAIANTAAWAKSGVMIRESLNAGSRYAATVVSSTNGVVSQWRPVANEGSVATGQAGYGAPLWVRITRVGDLLTSSRSSDGLTWTAFESKTVTMGANVYIGIANTATNTSTLGATRISNVSVTP